MHVNIWRTCVNEWPYYTSQWNVIKPRKIMIMMMMTTKMMMMTTDMSDLRLTSLSWSGSRGILFIMSLSACSYASEMAGTRSVPRSIQRMVMVPSGRGTSARMKMRNGEISGMLLVRVYAIDFLRLSKMRRPVHGRCKPTTLQNCKS